MAIVQMQGHTALNQVVIGGWDDVNRFKIC